MSRGSFTFSVPQIATGKIGAPVRSASSADPASPTDFFVTGRLTGLPRFTTTTLRTVSQTAGAAYVARLRAGAPARPWAWAVAPDGGGTVRIEQMARDGQGKHAGASRHARGLTAWP